MKKSIIFLFFTINTSLAGSFCTGEIQKFPLTDPNDGKTWEVTAKVYRPSGINKPKFPIVFVLPPIFGDTPFDKTLAMNFCLRGLGTYILNLAKEVPYDTEMRNLFVHNETLIRSHAGVSTIIDQLEKDPKINGRFAILGASMGAMISAYVAGMEKRINSSVIIAGAANLPGVLAQSEQEHIKKLRKDRMKAFGLTTPAEYQKMMELFLPNDPIFVAKNIKPDSMFIFVLTKDKDVPTNFQNTLKAAVPLPVVREMKSTHIPGIIKVVTLHADRITHFLKKRLTNED